MYKLQSVAIWVDVETKTLYSCDASGQPFKQNGIRLGDLNENWFNYLDREDKEYLSNLVKNKNN
jgi:flavorubredoxin